MMKSPLAPHRALPSGYVLDIYQFERVLGKPGAFGITYAAIDLPSQRRVAVKELFPSDYVVRDNTGQVVVQTAADESVFVQAVQMFRREADILSRVNHANVVRVFDYLEANGTAYMIMGYEDGYDLGRHLDEQRPHRPNQNELTRLLIPLLDGLEAVHNLQYLHRDIKPSNIYLTRRHCPLLLDFGAARQIVVSRSRPVEQILTPPFAPIEQYGEVSPQGPFTDIYALGVVVFKAILHTEVFPNAPDRMKQDSFVPLSRCLRGQEYSDRFLNAIDWALSLRSSDRPQSIAAWRGAIENDIRAKKIAESEPRPPPLNYFANAGIISPVAGFDPDAPKGRQGRARIFWRILTTTICAILGCILFALIVAWVLSD